MAWQGNKADQRVYNNNAMHENSWEAEQPCNDRGDDSNFHRQANVWLGGGL